MTLDEAKVYIKKLEDRLVKIDEILQSEHPRPEEMVAWITVNGNLRKVHIQKITESVDFYSSRVYIEGTISLLDTRDYVNNS